MAHTAQGFADNVRYGLLTADPVARVLTVRARGKKAVLGFEEAGVWVPLLRFSGASASFNVMSLDVRQGSRWAPTFERGTPAMLVDKLLAEFVFTWRVEAEANLAWRETSDPKH